jgi:thiol-disulfide isomerase/thioredoxin
MNKVKDLLLIPVIFLVVWLAIKWYKMPGQSSGAMAPDFVGYLANGDSLQLSDFKGDLVFLDFWGSWCGPCRAYNKGLVEIYQKYKNTKFKKERKLTIISVGIEIQKNYWLTAIQQDGLVWPNHVSDINRLYDHVALLYGIKEIPNTFLIDGNGQIIGVNLLEEKLDEILAQRSQK